MIRCSIPILLFSLTLFSCEKAKNLADQAKSAVEDKISGKAGATKATQPDPELQKLVDQAPDGVIFRKDLPFPKNVDVRTTVRQEIVGRTIQSSAIDTHSEETKGIKTVITKLERTGDQVRYTLEQSTFTAPPVEGAEAAKGGTADPLARMNPMSKPTTYQKIGKIWQPSSTGGFRTAALAKLLSPVFDQLLIENALAPRTLWFGKRRFKAGDKILVNGSTLPMLLVGNATGSFNLTFEKSEAVEGHPCGVFSVTGNFNRKQFLDFEGDVLDQDASIESGKIWLSLLYPIVLKQELDTIQTTSSGGNGGSSERRQGKVKLSLIREWKAKP